jgi:aspartate-semialdehyde dehydrogenase
VPTPAQFHDAPISTPAAAPARSAIPALLTYNLPATGRMTELQRDALRTALAGRTLALVGATGAVGLETLALLAEIGFSEDRIRCSASAASVGRTLPFGERTLPVHAIDEADVAAADAAILCLSADLSRDLAPRLADRGGRVIDHSSAFRQHPDVPLVIPEINAHALATAFLRDGVRIVASPNCTTTIALMAAAPLRDAFGLARLTLSSYQALSGAGLGALASLERELAAALAERPAGPDFFPVPAAFNAFPHESPRAAVSRASEEERKAALESRRILAEPALAVEATCMRVPTIRTHLISLRLELARPATIAEAEAALRSAAGVRFAEEASDIHELSSLGAAGRCDVTVGRVRPADPLCDDPDAPHRTLLLCAAGDQLLKGSAWNGLQIAGLLPGGD